MLERTLLTIIFFCLSSSLLAEEVVLRCEGVSGVPFAPEAHESDIESELYRFNVRTIEAPIIIRVNEKVITKIRVDGRGFYAKNGAKEVRGQTIGMNTNGSVITFTTYEWPFGVINYTFDKSRGLLGKSDPSYTFGRDDDPEPRNGRITVTLVLYKCKTETLQ